MTQEKRRIRVKTRRRVAKEFVDSEGNTLSVSDSLFDINLSETEASSSLFSDSGSEDTTPSISTSLFDIDIPSAESSSKLFSGSSDAADEHSSSSEYSSVSRVSSEIAAVYSDLGSEKGIGCCC